MRKNCFLFLILISGCGLPSSESIESPSFIETGLDTSAAFQTPLDDQNIAGYILYYKVYTGNSDYDSVGEPDREKFDDVTQYNNNEVPAGSIVPKQQGFFRMGKADGSTLDEPVINQNTVAAGTTVYIEYDENKKLIAYTDKDDPQNSTVQELARGVVDFNSADSPFLSFDDWVFDSNNYTDVDLYRNKSTAGFLDYQPASTQAIYNTATETSRSIPLTDIDDKLDEAIPIQIGVVVHSTGIDPQSLQPLNSIPIHLGKIELGVPTSTR